MSEDSDDYAATIELVTSLLPAEHRPPPILAQVTFAHAGQHRGFEIENGSWSRASEDTALLLGKIHFRGETLVDVAKNIRKAVASDPAMLRVSEPFTEAANDMLDVIAHHLATHAQISWAVASDDKDARVWQAAQQVTDVVWPSDRAFFERYPSRRYRVRHAWDSEVKANMVLVSASLAALALRPGDCWWCVVRQEKPGKRYRLLFQESRSLPIGDCGETAARRIWKQVAPADWRNKVSCTIG